MLPALRRWTKIALALCGMCSATQPLVAQDYLPSQYGLPPQYAPSGPLMPAYGGGCPPGIGCPPGAGTPGHVINELLPADRGVDFASGFDDALHLALENIEFRLEYVHLDVKDPGSTLLGAPSVVGVEDPTQFFPIDDGTGSIIGEGKVLTLEPVELEDVPGIKATVGLPINVGMFEASIWATRQEDDAVQFMQPPFLIDDFIDPVIDPTAPAPLPEFQATSLFQDGQPSSLTILNDRFVASFQTQTVNAEANVYFDYNNSGLGVIVQPMVGFRYMHINETLDQKGEFDNTGFIDPPLVNRIFSDATNNVYGLSFGLRTEYATPQLTLGIEPKVTLGANTYDNEVTTNMLRDPLDPPFSTTQDGVNFVPMLDLSAYAQVHLREWFSLHVGYTLLLTSGISRPDGGIFYNDTGFPPNPPGVVAKENSEAWYVQGLTVGGEFRFK